MINTPELKAEIARSSMTQEELANRIGLNPSTLNRKINGKNAVFTVSEAQALIKVLNIPNDRCTAIFFAEKLA